MKKFIISVIILAIFGGFVFFLGWIQFYVPNGHTGIMMSKTSGIDPIPVRPGEFRWAWEKLLPTNCEILVFSMKPWEGTLSNSGELPSASFYSRFLDGSPDFTWKISAAISVRPRPEKLHSLVEKYALKSEEDLDSFISNETNRAFSAVSGKILNEGAEAAINRVEGGKKLPFLFDPSAFSNYLNEEISPELEILSVSVTDSSLPDFNLYAEGAAVYSSYSEKHRQVAESIALRAAEEDINEKEQMKRFAEWGAFLEKFPSLIDFLAVARDDASGTLELLRSLQTEGTGQ